MPLRLVDHVGAALGEVREVLDLLAADETVEAFARLEELEERLEHVHHWFSLGGAQ